MLFRSVEEQSFDAWGRNRNVTNWSYDNISATSLLFRGYTGHEMLHEFGLINMNGRMYDPVLGRMLSPDNYVQSPFMPQNYNRYSYCWNNPLMFTDPDGEIVTLIIGAVIGAYFGGMRATMQGESFGYGAWRGALVGAVGGALSLVGGGTFAANVAWGMGEGALTGGLDAALWGNDIGKGMLWGAVMGGAFASVTSGIESYGNYKEGYGFSTDVGRFNKYVNEGDYQGALDFWSYKYDLPSMHVGEKCYTNIRTGEISISKNAFDKSPKAARLAIAHESGHYYDDIVVSINETIGDKNTPPSFSVELSPRADMKFST